MAPEVIACDENPDATYDNRNAATKIDKIYIEHPLDISSLDLCTI